MGTACCIPFFSNLLKKPKVYSRFNAHSLPQLSTGWDSKWTCQEGVWSVHCNFAFMIANFCNIYNVYVMWMVPSWQLWHLQVNVHKMQLVPSRLSGLFVKITFIFRHPGPLAFRPIFAMHTWCCHLVSDSQWAHEDSDWQIFHIFAQLDAVHSLGILYFSQLNVFDSHTPWCLARPQYHEEVSQFGIESNCESDGFGKSRSFFKREPQHSGLPVKSFFHCCASRNSLSGVETEVLTLVLTQVFSSCQMLLGCYCKGRVLKFSWGRWPRTRVEFTAAPIHQLHCQMLL